MVKVPDVLESAANAYTLLLENDRVRVLEIRLKPGEKAAMHNHPGDHVIYVLNGAKMKLSFPDGTSDEFDLKTGKALWMEAGSHATENIGKTEAHNLAIEIKK
jgi:quercetin dioxygenase-like cupin family protein